MDISLQWSSVEKILADLQDQLKVDKSFRYHLKLELAQRFRELEIQAGSKLDARVLVFMDVIRYTSFLNLTQELALAKLGDFIEKASVMVAETNKVE